MVQEEGVLGATGGVAQDEASDEPGVGGQTGLGVRRLMVNPPHALLCSPHKAPWCSPPDGLCCPLPLGCLPPAQRSTPPRLDADGCRGDHRWLTSIFLPWWPPLAPDPAPPENPGPTNLIASPGGISAASESPSRQLGFLWLQLGKKGNWPERGEPAGSLVLSALHEWHEWESG